MFIFEIHGNPVPQQQTRFANGMTYNPSKKDEEFIRWQIKPFAPTTPLSCPVELTLIFFLPIPKATSRIKRQQMINRTLLPSMRPDVDNLAYLVTNSLKKLVYDDDSRVCACHIYKFYGEEPKTVIKVRPIRTFEEMGIPEIVGGEIFQGTECLSASSPKSEPFSQGGETPKRKRNNPAPPAKVVRLTQSMLRT